MSKNELMDQEMKEAIELRTQDTSSKAVGKFRQFCSETTAHGFGRLASSSSTLEKFLWSACLLAALGYMTYQGIILVSDYLSYPVDVKVELKYTETLDFPAVVVCNMNMVKKSARKKAIEQGMMPNEDLMRDMRKSHGGKHNRKASSFWKDAMVASLDANVKKFIGHQAEDFIVGCYWKGEVCGPKNFTFLYNFVYGNCYVFSEKNNTKYITEPGSENGLSLTLNIEADEYLAEFSESYGAIVDVTSSKEMHFPEENGYLVAPGQVTNIGFTRRLIKRLGMPYEGTECGGHGEELIYKNRSYSETACRKTCAAKNQLAQCGCAEVAYPVEPNCDPFNSTQVHCVKNVSYQIRRAQIKCNCSEDCKLFEYPATISSAIWPTEAYLLRLRNTSNLTGRAPKVTSGILKARKNLALVNVYYKSMTVEIIQQEQRIWPEDLLGSIGGSMGLFTGVSLLTLMEFFKLLFDLMGYFCRKQASIVKPVTTGKDVGEKVFNS